eukprot:CAMPEP_0176438254 /NCGR_PEP_ID=MMETSP0127-20121128/19162_1 /TAXON_ID=938130 /ORGANISM="Platyophrya macrostoma, Strain WH" /LENGTH=105 /DNA_ID=CAMNT_0017822145 /DNA_START=35 /DNA_END=352 /DNA_ORIENTATION=+
MTSPLASRDLIKREQLSDSAKWEFIFDNATKQSAVGFLAGSALSFVLFQAVPVRMAVAAFGGGFGLGRAYVDARYVLGHDVTASAQWGSAATTPDGSASTTTTTE